MRLKDHVSKKDFWHEALVFVSKDNNLNKAHEVSGVADD